MTTNFEKMLHNYHLTTANIFYHFPDHPHLLQSYIWQEFDLLPALPNLHNFLHFWEHSLDGKLHSVEITHSRLLKRSDFDLIDGEIVLH